MSLIKLLRERFPAPEYAFFEELRNGTGFSRRTTRSADAVAFSLWPSRGLELHGFECKVSRSDWLRELKAPSKAEELAQFCDRWWIVVSDAELVQPGELPPTWGLLAPKQRGGVTKLATVKEAPKLEAKPLDRPMLASLFRNLHEGETARASARFAEEVDKQLQERARGDQLRLQRLEKEHEELRATVRDFEKASGIEIAFSGSPIVNVGAAVRALLKGGEAIEQLKVHAHWAANQYRGGLREAEALEAALEAAIPSKKTEAA